MNTFTITRRIDAPATTIWGVLEDFGNIANWSPGIRRSALTSDGVVGEGTTRHCDFVPLGGVNERITRFVPREQMTVHLYETFKMPVSDAVADFQIHSFGEASELTLEVSYTPNRLGRVAKNTTSKQMRKAMSALADDLATESERVAGRSRDEDDHAAA